MPYTALPDHRIPYDNDGTLVYFGSGVVGATTAATGAQLLELQDEDYVTTGPTGSSGTTATGMTIFFFFPHQSEVTGIFCVADFGLINLPLGSNDTANGVDGTWETASLPGGAPSPTGQVATVDSWRAGIKPISFTGPKKNVRISLGTGGGGCTWAIAHIYGEAAAGQMAHDLVFLDPDLGAGIAFPAPEDFGDQPLGTTVVRPFRLKNTSGSRTATTINIQCNDPDFTIGESASGPWVVTINVASLAAGAETATFYTRCTTPAPGAPLKPRFARIVVVCDSGFFG